MYMMITCDPQVRRRSLPAAGRRALLVTLQQESEIIAAIEEEGPHPHDGITDASRDQECRLEQALEHRCETLDRIITTVAATLAGLRIKAEALGRLALAYAVSRRTRLWRRSPSVEPGGAALRCLLPATCWHGGRGMSALAANRAKSAEGVRSVESDTEASRLGTQPTPDTCGAATTVADIPVPTKNIHLVRLHKEIQSQRPV
jgi:hypothetical protein